MDERRLATEEGVRYDLRGGEGDGGSATDVFASAGVPLVCLEPEPVAWVSSCTGNQPQAKTEADSYAPRSRPLDSDGAKRAFSDSYSLLPY